VHRTEIKAKTSFSCCRNFN